MIAAAEKRNAAHVAAGRARFVTAELEAVDLRRERFDKVLAVRFPPLLRGRADRALAKVRGHLVRGGGLYVVEHARDPGGTADGIVARLEEHGFTVGSVVVEEGDRPAVCVVATPGQPAARHHSARSGARRMRGPPGRRPRYWG